MKVTRLRCALFFLCSVLGVGLLACTDDAPGNNDLNQVLQSIERIDQSNDRQNYTLLAIGEGTSVAKECVKITYPGGGNTKYCGPNTDTIIANCSKRNWKCEKVNGRKLIQGLRFMNTPEFEDNDIEIAVAFGEEDIARIRLRSGSDSDSASEPDLECNFNNVAPTVSEGFCLKMTTENNCTGCSTESDGQGGGSVTCTDCSP